MSNADSRPAHDPAAGIANGILERARAVRLLLLDVDGVLTDGGLRYDDGGGEAKTFHVHDGHGLKMLQAQGVPVGGSLEYLDDGTLLAAMNARRSV